MVKYDYEQIEITGIKERFVKTYEERNQREKDYFA